MIVGIIIGISICLPLLGIAAGKWIYWKSESEFWKMMLRDLEKHNEGLFERLKIAEDRVMSLEKKSGMHQFKALKIFKEADDGNDKL